MSYEVICLDNGLAVYFSTLLQGPCSLYVRSEELNFA